MKYLHCLYETSLSSAAICIPYTVLCCIVIYNIVTVLMISKERKLMRAMVKAPRA